MYLLLQQIDIPLSPIFYKWLLSQESTLTIGDMQQIDSTFSRSVTEMERIAQQKLKIVYIFNLFLIYFNRISINRSKVMIRIKTKVLNH